MRDKILKVLQNKGVSVYSINEIDEETFELFFVKKNLALPRAKNIKKYSLTVYRDMESENGKLRGSSNVCLYPEMTDNEIEESIDKAYFAAGYAGNRYYEIPSGSKEDTVIVPGQLNDMSVKDIAYKMAEALYSVDDNDTAFINSAEIFAIRRNCRVLNSQGVDVNYIKSEVKGEFVTQCISEGNDVEFYQDFGYDDLMVKELARKAKDALQIVSDRAKAKAAAKVGVYDVILSGKNIGEFLDFYKDRSDASMIYPKYSSYTQGCNVQGEGVEGEDLNIGLAATEPYSIEGIRMTDRPLLGDGKLKMIHGSSRFCSYLGVEPTGNYSKLVCLNGSIHYRDMIKQPYLHIVSFSDFQMDSFSGHFGGEIRLAYYYDGDKVVNVTGGSINGNIFEAQKNMVFSMEKYYDSNYEGPQYVKLKNINVSGVV